MAFPQRASFLTNDLLLMSFNAGQWTKIKWTPQAAFFLFANCPKTNDRKNAFFVTRILFCPHGLKKYGGWQCCKAPTDAVPQPLGGGCSHTIFPAVTLLYQYPHIYGKFF